jgi:hypothetical protein
MADDLRIDAAFADTARDQLRVLAAEIDDEDGTILRSGLRKLNDLNACNSAPPS